MGCGGSKDKKADAPSQSGSSETDRLNFLNKVNLFKQIPEEDRPALASTCEDVSFEAGMTVIRQGDDGHEFFVIKKGTAKVEVGGNVVATLRVGDFFGETALLREEPRTATIIAQSSLETLKITREAFQKLHLHEKLEFPKRGAVGGGVAKDAVVNPPDEKTDQEKTLMIQALMKNQSLNTMVTMTNECASQLIEPMWKVEVAQGHAVIQEGDLDADYFYIVQSGKFEVTKAQSGQNAVQVATASIVKTLAPGDSFGELALLYYAPRAATVTALESATLWVLARQQFKQIVAKMAEESSYSSVEYLKKVPVLAPLKPGEMNQLSQALQEMIFMQGEYIFEQDEPGKLFYILVHGECCVEKDGKQEATLKASDGQCPFFGESALLGQGKRGASIKVVSASARTLTVDKTSFDMLLGDLAEITKRGKDGDQAIAKAKAGGDQTRRFGNIVRKDLKRLGLLGCGGFGAVELVEHVKTQDMYALKALSKGYVVKSGMQQSVMSEKNVQLMCDSKFIVKLFETFNGEQSLYFLLELALGGELYATYNKKGLWGNENCAKYYVGGTLFAFEHLHEKKVIFRDLKPENLLLNQLGHVKLTDMGLAKVVVGKTYTTCGTPDYFAPELIASKGHTHAVDWWTLGILTFELLAGHPPFESASPMQIYQKVTKGIGKVTFPKRCKGKPESLIKSLCNSNPAERLPMKKGTTDNVKKHPWFADFQWDALFNLTLKPPYVPAVKNQKDMSNFSARKEDMPPQIPYKDDKSGWDKDFATSE